MTPQAQLAFIRRLGADWKHLAVALGIPPATRFDWERKEDTGSLIWDWLYNLGRLSELPAALRQIERVDLAELLESTGEVSSLWQSRMPLPARCRLPYPPLGELFIGREPLLREIRQGFEQARQRGQWPSQVLRGLGGVGKTRLAVEYAWKHREDYAAVLFLNGESSATLQQDLGQLAGILELQLPEGTTVPEQVQAVRNWLRSHPGWLLIVDNVDDQSARDAVAQLLSDCPQGHLLITARYQHWPPEVQPLQVQVLAQEDARDYLLRSTQASRQLAAEDQTLASDLAGELGQLCLALSQASAYINCKGISLRKYRERWAQNAKQVRQWADKTLMRYHEEKAVSLSIATTWQTTFEALSAEGRSLLQLLCWLSSAPLPTFLLEHESLATSLRELAGEDADVEESLAELRRYSLLDRAEETTFPSEGSLHPLVQLIARDQLPPELRTTTLQSVLNGVNTVATGNPEDVRTWNIWKPLEPHLAAVVEHVGRLGIPEPTTRLMNLLGMYYQTQALYHLTEPLYRRALAIDEQNYGEKHPTVAPSLNNLAELLRVTNRLSEAEPLIRRALRINEDALGENHPTVAIQLNVLSLVLKDTNRLSEAESLMRRALAIDEQNYGENHPNVASRLNNLVSLLQATNRLSEAEPLMRRALAIDEQNYGENHPTVAIDLNNLALLLQTTHRLSEAEPLMERVVRIFEISFGEHHPNVATALNNLATLLQDTNRLSEAEPLMRRALAINEHSYGEHHPSVAIHLNNLAMLLWAASRLTEAEPLMVRQLTIFCDFTRNTGHQHPHLQAAIRNSTRLLKQMQLPEPEIQARLREAGVLPEWVSEE